MTHRERPVRYLSGTAALNIHEPGDRTPGDWHHSAVNWDHPLICERDESDPALAHLRPVTLTDAATIPEPLRALPVADHVLACADLIAGGYYGSAMGMRKSFLDDPAANLEAMGIVYADVNGRQDVGIERFMGSEYGAAWLRFKEGAHEGH